MPLAEVAAVLDLPLGTVKSRLAYGLKALRQLPAIKGVLMADDVEGCYEISERPIAAGAGLLGVVALFVAIVWRSERSSHGAGQRRLCQDSSAHSKCSLSPPSRKCCSSRAARAS